MSAPSSSPPPPRLTPRQIELLRDLSKGPVFDSSRHVTRIGNCLVRKGLAVYHRHSLKFHITNAGIAFLTPSAPF